MRLTGHTTYIMLKSAGGLSDLGSAPSLGGLDDLGGLGGFSSSYDAGGNFGGLDSGLYGDVSTPP